MKMRIGVILSPLLRTGYGFMSRSLPQLFTSARVSNKINVINKGCTLRNTSSMADEYDNLDSSGRICTLEDYKLECGKLLRKPQVCYNTWGTLNEKQDNAMVVCHALTGNSNLESWWGGLLGPGKVFDTDKYYVICANVISSCYGSTSHASIDPDTGRPYGRYFGPITVRDSVGMHLQMVKTLGVNKIACVIGGSLGGMQALEWMALGGDMVNSAVIIGCGATHTSWQIAVSEAQRQAIYADPRWQGGSYDPSNPPAQGLAVARQIAMVTYRSAEGYHKKFGREVQEEKGIFKVRSYLEYQGQKFLTRFDPLSYVQMTELMDSHDVGRNRGGVDEALGNLEQKALVIGIDSDILYPLWMQEELAAKMPNAELKIVKSIDGHDAFLLEQAQISSFINNFLGESSESNSLDDS
mmetsp:Transcript_7736/g.10300  ORF Transcript_7736/g.10300 Transcript_7736/m.10300 type:complete len:411 (+) Transcript_7736:76-1308(+)